MAPLRQRLLKSPILRYFSPTSTFQLTIAALVLIAAKLPRSHVESSIRDASFLIAAAVNRSKLLKYLSF
jgi:hypothetical protein